MTSAQEHCVPRLGEMTRAAGRHHGKGVDGGSPGRNGAASRDKNGTSPTWHTSFGNQSTKAGNVVSVQKSNTALLSILARRGDSHQFQKAEEGCRLRDPSFVRQPRKGKKQDPRETLGILLKCRWGEENLDALRPVQE